MASSKLERSDQDDWERMARVPPGLDDSIVLWDGPDGVRCVIRHYDETRYQLRLLRRDGTIKSDLFSDHPQALAASREWRRHFQAVGSKGAAPG